MITSGTLADWFVVVEEEDELTGMNKKNDFQENSTFVENINVFEDLLRGCKCFILQGQHAREKTNTVSDNDYSPTYSELGGSRRSLVETEHDDLQAVTAVGAFEEARLQQIRRHRGRQVYPPVCQAVTVTRKQTKATDFT